jgi:hypothetical protein
MTDGIEKVIAGIGLIAAAFAIEFGLSCARAWLLSLVVALFAPAIAPHFLAMAASGGDHSLYVYQS